MAYSRDLKGGISNLPASVGPGSSLGNIYRDNLCISMFCVDEAPMESSDEKSCISLAKIVISCGIVIAPLSLPVKSISFLAKLHFDHSQF